MIVSGLYVFANAYACVVPMMTFSAEVEDEGMAQMMVKSATLLRHGQRHRKKRNSWHPTMATPAQKHTHMGGP